MIEASPFPPPSTDSDSDSATNTLGAVLTIELTMQRNRESFALNAKYPLRPNAVLTAEQLTAARAQLGPAGFVAPRKRSRRDEDRRPLTAEEVRRARVLAGTP